MKRFMPLAFIALVFFLVSAAPALAHKVVVFAYAEQGQIFVESGFGSKRPCKQSRVVVFRADAGDLVHEGQTNDQGKYQFDIPSGLDQALRVRVEAGPGHAGEWLLALDHISSALPASPQENPLDAPTEPWRIGLGIFIIFALCFCYRWFKGNPMDKYRVTHE